MAVLIVLSAIAFILAFFTATLGYLRAKIAAAERELRAEEEAHARGEDSTVSG